MKRVEDAGETVSMFVDLALGKRTWEDRVWHSASAKLVKRLLTCTMLIFTIITSIRRSGLHDADMELAYHDRSDGGLLATLTEMMFAGVEACKS